MKKILWLKKNKNTVSWTYVINGLKGEEIVGMFSEKESQQTNQKELGVKKVIKQRDKLYVKWKGWNDENHENENER